MRVGCGQTTGSIGLSTTASGSNWQDGPCVRDNLERSPCEPIGKESGRWWRLRPSMTTLPPCCVGLRRLRWGPKGSGSPSNFVRLVLVVGVVNFLCVTKVRGLFPPQVAGLVSPRSIGCLGPLTCRTPKSSVRSKTTRPHWNARLAKLQVECLPDLNPCLLAKGCPAERLVCPFGMWL